MAFKRDKAKGRKEDGPVLLIPHTVLNHPDYPKLTGSALRLLLELARQFNGHTNNGDLTASWAIMRDRGFNSTATLSKAVAELLSRGFIVRTREGRFVNPGKRCALYAVAWKPINECPGKDLEIGPTTKPWRTFTAEIIKMPASETESTRFRNCIDEAKKHG